jgi:hypothetical protein
VEIRDIAANRSDYEPKEDTKYLATDTEAVSLGDGDSWQHIGTLSDTDEQGDGSIVAQPGKVQSTLGYGILALRLTMGWVLRRAGSQSW